MAKKFYGKSGFYIVSNTLSSGMKHFFQKVNPKAREKASIALGLQLLNNAVNGSPRSSVRAPIRDGRLRGSGTVFVGDKKVGDSLFAGRGGTPAQSYSEKNPTTIVVGFNTEYAANMHENLSPYGKKFIPGGHGGRSIDSVADVGGKFLERHLQADKEELIQLFADTYKKFAGT